MLIFSRSIRSKNRWVALYHILALVPETMHVHVHVYIVLDSSLILIKQKTVK